MRTTSADGPGSRILRTRWLWVTLGGITVAALIVRVLGLGDHPLSLDEAYTAWVARGPLGDMWQPQAPLDAVSPLYDTLLKAWTGLGDSPATLRLLSVFLGTATIPATFFVARRAAGPGLGLVAAVLVALSPFHIEMSQTVGPFVMVVLGATVALEGLMRMRSRDGARAGPTLYAAGMAAAIMGHGSALALLAAFNAGVAVWWRHTMRRLPPGGWWRLQGVTLVVTALWLPALAADALGTDVARGIDTSSLGQVGVALHNVYAGSTLFVAGALRPVMALGVGLVLAALVAAAWWRRPQDRDWLLAALVTVAVGGIIVLAAATWRPILDTSLLAWAVVPILVVSSAGAVALPRSWLAAVGIAAVGAVSVFGVWKYFGEVNGEEWDQVADYMAEKVGNDDLVLFSVAAARLPIEDYLDGNLPGVTVAAGEFDAGLGPQISAADLGRLRELIDGHPKVWLVLAQSRLTDPLGLINFELERSGAVVDQQRFGGVSLVAYDIGARIDFQRVSFPIDGSPTAMAIGPDGRLYVAEVLGTIHAYTLDDAGMIVADEVIDSLIEAHGGPRLTLGLAVDPDSTPDDVILWVSHSHGEVFIGELNTGMVSRLSGPGFSDVRDVITGLPRSYANHATNSIHFGPDGKLYLAQGGNTGAGAANLGRSEFRDMAEQPLSAALLVADVKAPGFDGSCFNTEDMFAPAPCDVTPYATGMRNMYDFVFHSNGHIYGPDNGLGVVGAYPPVATPPCTGLADATDYLDGGDNPGEQPDLLYDIVAGAYYGHPNPSRGECVFKDGSWQGVPASTAYRPPIADLGDHRSADGVIEYTSDAFCGELQGDLLITNFVTGDISRIELSADGKTVESVGSVLAGFASPLPLATTPDGIIYVGEYAANPPRITALVPMPGCWKTDHRPSPEAILDGSGTVVDGKVYLVAGKTPRGPQNTLYIYDPGNDSWTRGADLPGPAVEDPAVTEHDGKLYVFGGAPLPFSGAVTNAAMYDPAADSWTELPPLPRPRAGAAAEALGDLIYVAGGMDPRAVSLDSMDVYDPEHGTWTPGPPMGTPRDNPGSAVLGGEMFVFGGRTRLPDGTLVEGELATTESFDPATGTWRERAPMPTGRRRMVVAVLGDTALLIGGEQPPGGGAFAANERYDPATDSWELLAPVPTPRHGAVGGTVDGVVYVIAGSPGRGIFAVDAVESFTLEPR